MAEGIVSFAMEGLLKKVVSVAAEEVRLAWGFKGELKRLGESLTTIQAVLEDAERRQVRDKAVKLWLKKLGDVAHDAEDVLDEFAYEILRRKVELQNRLKKKVRNFFSLSNPIAFRLKMAHKVKSINILLNAINKEAADFGLHVSRVDPTPQNDQLIPETDSFVDHSGVVGREKDASKIVKILINSGNQEALSVIPIVGMAGIGKTTLAQFVYRDVEIERHFDAKIWVCVSENFETKRILRECLESLTSEKVGMENMNAILEKLQTKLGGKRYLLVLDDVWNEELVRWDDLKSRLSLVNTTKGNTIIVTTRSDQVASIMETIPRYHLEILSEEECWSIFKDGAFSNGGAPMTPDLEAIGREIVKKCAGVPLAAKVLGSMMRSKRGKDEWLSIQDNEIWELPEEQNGILHALKLSFTHLPSPSLKQCFAYCSMFAKDFVIEKNNLIQLWMARGLLQPPQGSNLEMEDIGNNFFKILLVNSLFQDATKDKYDNIKNCKMHDLVHDLAQFVSRFESSTLETSEVNDKLEIRHLSLISEGEILPTIPRESAKKVHTIFSEGDILGNMLSKFKGLRVLNLEGAGIEELPISIGKLIHLRYLDVSETNIIVFPKSIAKLYNLQTLRLMGCSALREFPKDLRNLINLRHFCYDQDEIVEMPADMRRLTNLQTFPYFLATPNKGHQIEELGCLNKLKGKLIIGGLEHVRDGKEAKKANLLAKTNIYKLLLVWTREEEEEEEEEGGGGSNNDEDVLGGLQPHTNLKSLSIGGFRGDKFPSWVMTMAVNTKNHGSFLPLNNLVMVRLYDCPKCEQIPMLGHLPCLRDLEITSMDNVKCIGAEFYGCNHDGGSSGGSSATKALFPALKKLGLESMDELVEWVPASSGVVVFPCLEELTLTSCPKLTAMPSHFSSLRELCIADVKGSVTLANIDSNLTTLTFLNISRVPDLTSLPEGLFQNNKDLVDLTIEGCPALTIAPHVLGYCTSLQRLCLIGGPYIESINGFTSLRKLQIESCDALTSLPRGLEFCTSLERLVILRCSNLMSFPESDLRGLRSLSSLIIAECGKLKDLSEGLHCFTSLRELHIESCDALTSLPRGLEFCTSLEDLIIQRCSNLMSFPESDLRGLRYLSSLTIAECGKLKGLPEGLHCLTRLKTLRIGGFWEELDSFPNFEDILQLHQLRGLELYGWPKLKSLPHQLQHFTALTYLSILNFDGLEALPDWLGNLSSLQRLQIERCKNVMYLPSMEAMRRLTKLDALTIDNCPLLKERCAKESGPEWSKISHVPDVYYWD